ncbi:MAG: alpha/beta fold hydrolase [Promicromonosporaceae bacterium]|nr:alpha/beta fold hydrolase [Promicromonosporaceae bacterium]
MRETRRSTIHLAYSVAGSGPPLILLHGNGEDSRIFCALVAALRSRFTVYALDSRGHGRSSAAPLGYSRMADDVAAFIMALGLKRPVLFGFSDGGIIGLLVALRHPGLLGALAIGGANIHPFGISAGEFARTVMAYMRRPNAFTKLLLTGPFITRRRLARINIPVLVIAGSMDLIRRRHTQAIADAIPGARLTILDGADHGNYVIDSAFLAPLLTRFFLHDDDCESSGVAPQRSEIPQRLKRVRVIGSPGSGKSTFARELAVVLRVPDLELDAAFWAPNWQMREMDEGREIVQDWLGESGANGWVIDGNWPKYTAGMFDDVDAIVWLDYSRSVVMWRIITRTLKRMITRQELWNGNRERFSNLYSRDPEKNIIVWAWTHFDSYRQRYAELAKLDQRVVRLGNPQAAESWLRRTAKTTSADLINYPRDSRV